jgi:uncharacterized protein YjbJ (UPF0337 family)
MDKNRIKGTVKEAEGTVKEAAGKVLKNQRLIDAGRQEKIEGRVQQTVGVVRDSLRGK